MAKSPDDLDAALNRVLRRKFFRKAGLTEANWRHFITVAIPQDWAEAFVAESDGDIAMIDWPSVIRHAPSLTRSRDQVNTPEMDSDHKLSISGGRLSERASDDARFIAALTKAGFTQGQLASKAGISPGMLSHARAGRKPIRARRAKRIEALIGFKATEANWPGGILPDEE